MTESDYKFVPVSDTCVSEMTIVERHNNLIKSGRYNDAVKLLDTNNHQTGFRASLFNMLRTRMMTIATYLLNVTAEPDEYYSTTEPDPAFMVENGKKYWIQPFE